MSPIRANLHRLHHHATGIRFNALMHHGPEYLKRWVPRLMRPLLEGVFDIQSLITGMYKLSEAPAAMQKFNEEEDQVKILLKP